MRVFTRWWDIAVDLIAIHNWIPWNMLMKFDIGEMEKNSFDEVAPIKLIKFN